MAEAFKDCIGGELVRTIGKHIQRVHASFPRRRFVTLASEGLAELELKARVQHVAEALAQTLPKSFAAATEVLERSLAPAPDDDDLSQLVTSAGGLAGWAVWPFTDFVARYGLRSPKRSLRTLHALTQRHTAEFAIRPYLVEHRELTLATLHAWLRDPSPHVRRLVSEGSRPRLPWGMQLKGLIADPSPTLPLLAHLQDDDSAYVRRSVANHLNDISKDHPDMIGLWLEQHLPAASPRRRSMLRHASRGLIKAGDQRVLKAWGMDSPLRGEAYLQIEPMVARVGESVTLTVTLAARAKQPQKLWIDYRIHHVKKSGATSPKTWKGWQLEVQAGEQRTLSKRYSLRPVTTRRDYPGRHQVDLLINGKLAASAAFDLRS